MSDREHQPVSASPPGTWAPARRAARAIAAPLQRVLEIEAASGALLMIATVAALALANSAWGGSFESLWRTPLGASVGDYGFERPLRFWIDDGLMTVFFLVVGLEIRREIFEGELRTLKLASLPLVAAVGGMCAPAALYVAFNAGRVGSGGWAVPMATDIAFAVGTLTVLGSRVPNTLRILLLALAVIDDIGAIVVIAVFFSVGITATGFWIAAAGIAGIVVMRAAAMRSPLAYVIPGIVIWLGLYTAGVHPTLAGVIVGLLTPVRPWADDVSPVDHLLQALRPWVSFGIMPLFALANAGVVFGHASFHGDALWVFVGIVVGLAVGKPLGITAAALVSSKLGVSTRPPGMRANGVALVGIVGGIGFTMSLFIAQLAFPDPILFATAQVGILVGSGVAMIAGLGFGLLALRSKRG